MGRYLTNLDSSSYDANLIFSQREPGAGSNVAVQRQGRSFGTKLVRRQLLRLVMLGRLTRTQISSIFPGFICFKKQSRRDSVVLGPGNVIDPMSRHPRNQDIFPKLDFLGGQLGDGFPFCSEQLLARAFLGRERASNVSKSLQGQLCCHCPQPSLAAVIRKRTCGLHIGGAHLGALRHGV